MSRSPALYALPAILAVLLVACASTSGGSAPFTVHGTVIGTQSGPVPGAQVAIGDRVTSTAADGTFVMDDVQVPYDVVLKAPGSQQVMIVQGLTRSDPTLAVNATSPWNRSASISGTIDSALTSTQLEYIVAGAPYTTQGMILLDNTSGTTFSNVPISWTEEPTLDAELYALKVQLDGTGHLSQFLGYGSRPLALTDTSNVSGVSITAASSVTTASVRGSFNVPPGYSLGTAGPLVRFGSASDGAVLVLPATISGTGAFTDGKVPVGPAFAYGLAASAKTSAGELTLAWSFSSSVPQQPTLSLRAAPALVAPAAGATGVTTGTTLSWTGPANALYVVLLVTPGSSSTTDPGIVIVTDKTSVTVPDLSALGWTLPASTALAYQVVAFGPYTSTDAFSASATPNGALSSMVATLAGYAYETGGPSADGWYSASVSRTVTTSAP